MIIFLHLFNATFKYFSELLRVVLKDVIGNRSEESHKLIIPQVLRFFTSFRMTKENIFLEQPLCSLKILYNECRIMLSLNFTSKRTYSKIIREICSSYKTQALSTFICAYLSPKYKGSVI